MTLIELLVALGLMATLLAVAVPAFEWLVTGSKLSSFTDSLYSSLYLARSEAIKRNARVVLCKSVDGASCAATGSWSQGWIMFHDNDNDAQLGSGELLIVRQDPLPNDLALWGNSPIAKYVSYTGLGSTRLTGGAFQAGTFTLCRVSADGGEARNIVISATGRPRIQKTTVASCP